MIIVLGYFPRRKRKVKRLVKGKTGDTSQGKGGKGGVFK